MVILTLDVAKFQLDTEVVKATFSAMKASSMARRLTTKSARRRSAWMQINNALD